MNKNSFLKIVSVNIFLLFICFEFLSRGILYIKNYNFEKKFLNEEVKDYLGFVNHMRNKSHINLFKKEKLKDDNIKLPLNINDKSFYILGVKSICKDNQNKETFDSWISLIKESNCPKILLQGDSWGEGLSIWGQDLFNEFEKNKWDILQGGTTSFSISNYSAQLAFLKSKNIVPDIVFLNIDQSDLGDDFYRYKDYISVNKNPIIHLKVDNFGFYEHRSFYNYYPYFPTNIIPPIYSIKPHSIILVKKLFMIISNKVKYKTKRKIDFSRTPTWTQISSPLTKTNQEAINHFKKLFAIYINTAKEAGVKELFISSHPHYKHIYENEMKEERYTYNLGNGIDDYLNKNHKNKESLRIFHKQIPKKLFDCPEITCNGYFFENDRASHPSPKGYKKFSSFILKNYKKYTNIGF